MLLRKTKNKPTTSLFIQNFPNADLNADGTSVFLCELSNHVLACI